MSDIEIHCNEEKGQKFIKSIERKHFLFSFVTSYTETCEIPGITVAGAEPDLIKLTPPADSEFLQYGFCKTIDIIPMTPDGKPTPALLTRAGLNFANIPKIVINAGSELFPKMPFIESNLPYGENISKKPALEQSVVKEAIDYGRIIGRTLASCTNLSLIHI